MNILVPDISIAEKRLRAAVAHTFRLAAFHLCARPCATTVSSRCGTSTTPSWRRTAT